MFKEISKSSILVFSKSKGKIIPNVFIDTIKLINFLGVFIDSTIQSLDHCYRGGQC